MRTAKLLSIKLFSILSLLLLVQALGLGQTVINGGRVIIGQSGVNMSGTSTPILPTLPTNSDFYIIDGPARYVAGGIANTGFYTAVRWDGTIGSLTAVQAAEQIGGFNAFAYNGTSLNGPIGAFRCYANQIQTTSNGGSYCDVATTVNGSMTETEVIRFENDGGITVPSTVTGGDQGTGTINAAGLYVNGVAVSTGGASFTAITSGTNTTAAMVVGTGASLTTSGSGTIVATSCTGCSSAFSAITTGANTTATMTVGTGASLTTSGSGTITATAVPFSGISTGTNTTATMTVGTGASLTASGSGTIAATSCTGCAVAFSAITTGANTTATMTIGTGASLTTSGSGTIAATSCTGCAVTLVINSTPITGGATNAVLYGDGTKLQNEAGVTRTGTGFLTFTQTALATTSADAVLLVNSTAATSGVPVQVSPCADLQGNAYNTTSTVSNTVSMRLCVVPLTGGNPAGTLNIQTSVNGGAYSTIFSLSTNNGITNVTSYSSNSFFQAAAGSYFDWSGRAVMRSPADSEISFTNAASTAFSYLDLGPDANTSFIRLAVTTQANPILSILNANGGSTAQLNVPGTQATATGDVNVCWKTTGLFTQGSVCGSSLAIYKQNIQPVQHGLDYVIQMRPVTFDWKQDGHHDIGMIADEVAAIDPLLGAYKADGSLYNFRDRAVLATLVKAVQEIETQIQELRARQ